MKGPHINLMKNTYAFLKLRCKLCYEQKINFVLVNFCLFASIQSHLYESMCLKHRLSQYDIFLDRNWINVDMQTCVESFQNFMEELWSKE